MKQITNPILPNYEYIPDPEPHVFDNRIYVYGSHDKFKGISFCLNDYIVYSCPIDDLTSWSSKGISYKKSQDPEYKGGFMNVMFAPDCCKGNDGNYYLYYTLGFSGHIGVAKSKFPDGPFEYYGNVKYKDGTKLGDLNEYLQFDPAIFIDDDKKIYLYSGYGSVQKFGLHGRKNTDKGAMVFVLDDDMLTIKEGPSYICKTIYNAKGTDFEGHEFFEASSMRKINNKYYFIYSSFNNHDLCYAISSYPDRDFVYGGVLVSNCDEGLKDHKTYYYGNNHGSLLCLNNEYYIFYHRQTHKNSFARQMCAEKLTFDGLHFAQAEMTSQGLNGKPLLANRSYHASICCNLYTDKGIFFYKVIRPIALSHPFITQERNDNEEEETQYIKNLSRHATIGYKYFSFDKRVLMMSVVVKGTFKGEMIIKDDEDGSIIGKIKISPCKNKTTFNGTLSIIKKVSPLFITFNGKGKLSFYEFEFK